MGNEAIVVLDDRGTVISLVAEIVVFAGEVAGLFRERNEPARFISEALLLHQQNLTRTPFLREKGFQRTVEAQDGEPTLARHRLDPVAAFHAFRLFGAEVDGRGTVGTRHSGGRWIALATGARVVLRPVVILFSWLFSFQLFLTLRFA